MSQYQKPPELYDGLRLHQNENTAGCSPRVLEALHALRADQVGYYPPYNAITERAARHFGVTVDDFALTNGLDEGIMATCIAHLRPAIGGFVPEVVIPEPAFEIYKYDTALAGGVVRHVAPRPDFTLPLEGVLAAITPQTRMVCLTSPNNPTGVSVSLDQVKTVAGAVPAGALVFLDEAYAEFEGRTFIPHLREYPNVVVGRTFSKAYGLAGLRVGALLAHPDTLLPIRYAIPTYSLSIAAVVALQAALDDPGFLEDYIRQVAESKALLYAACDRLGLGYWKSDANFVLVNAGSRTEALIAGAAARGVYFRNRSTEAGCAGCFRFGTGIVEHTTRGIAVMEEALCAGA